MITWTSPDGRIRLHNLDCMIGMAAMRDKQFELAIVDPPYSVGASDGKFGGKKEHQSKVYAADGKHYTNHSTRPEQDYFDQLFRVSNNQIIWGANYYPEFLYHSGWIVWDKLTTGPLSDCELAFQSTNKLVEKFTSAWTGFNKGNREERETLRIHPNQKPVNLYRWLLKKYAKPGNRILDTHAGSCSLAIACIDLGFELEAYELDADYFNAAVERIENHLKQPPLFKPEAAKPRQGELL
jgi:site-specific DNA-methyltransferase (adenine-specific)